MKPNGKITNVRETMTFKLMPPMLILASLASCGGGGDSTEPLTGSPPNQNSNKPTVIIETYAITSQSDTNLNDNTTEINANNNQGAFEITWTVNVQEPAYNTDTYVATVFLSDDTTLTLTEDFNLVSRVCGSVPNTDCSKEGKLTCTFTTKNFIECSTAGRTVSSKDVTYSLNTLPKSISLIFQACNVAGTATVCQEQAQQISFQ